MHLYLENLYGYISTSMKIQRVIHILLTAVNAGNSGHMDRGGYLLRESCLSNKTPRHAPFRLEKVVGYRARLCAALVWAGLSKGVNRVDATKPMFCQIDYD